ncbi:trk system potassium uptake protein TrkH [Pseudobutyrivibrio sp. NOR37]|uniref:Potassium transporter TrkH n=1 Tax=Pseudobutyrivibrio xylanivorans TaxID=185007 RepID=A0A6M0LP06_PSEXY|nr:MULTISPECIES: potassium transporter TrkG [Pseudobutyrivibrio]NEX02551.1 potassium transporter TrkH [Pseudobutyrivibrio xylanivorans]SFR82470.1 trk system potassium uptake protein TrkH [Pseudobutyrivibrio sp. NOR37]
MEKKKISSVQLIPLSFLIAIAIGGLILMLPISSAAGQWTNPLVAFFTSTTSTCVTGLVVVDTYSYFSTFGHIIILCLIQVGGLGIITVISMVMLITQKKFSLGDRKMLQESLNLDTDVGILRLLIRIFKDVFKVELFGAVLYSISFIPEFGVARGIWYSIFHSVSAFCNAGIDIIGDRSLMDYKSNPLVMCTTMILIVLGGLGYVVWFDMSEKIKAGIKKRFTPVQIFKRFEEHTKLVVTVTVTLIVSGALFFFIAEFKNAGTIGNLSLFDKTINSFFESITLRTAGFSSFPQENMTDFSCVMSYILMFIGGSPIGTAGGVKTVTIFLALLNVISYIHDDDQSIIFNRRVTDESMRKATVIVSVAAFAIVVLTLLLIVTNKVNMQDELYEVISASATVGLSRGLTSSLDSIGQIIIIVAMYLGRIGPISLAIFFAGRGHHKSKCRYLEGDFFVG